MLAKEYPDGPALAARTTAAKETCGIKKRSRDVGWQTGSAPDGTVASCSPPFRKDLRHVACTSALPRAAVSPRGKPARLGPATSAGRSAAPAGRAACAGSSAAFLSASTAAPGRQSRGGARIGTPGGQRRPRLHACPARIEREGARCGSGEAANRSKSRLLAEIPHLEIGHCQHRCRSRHRSDPEDADVVHAQLGIHVHKGGGGRGWMARRRFHGGTPYEVTRQY